MVTLLLEKIGAIQLESWVAISMAIIEIFYCAILVLRTIFSAFYSNIKNETKIKKFLEKSIEIFNVFLGALKILKEKGAEYGRERKESDSNSNGKSASDCASSRVDEDNRRIKK